MSDGIRSCEASEPALRVGDRILSLYLTNLLCEDETEHDGFGEGVANDAIRFSGLVTTQKGDGPPLQCKIPTKNLGDNYQDGTSVALNEEVVSILLSATDRYPVVVNVTFVLGEEDWGGKFDNAVDEIISFVSRVAKESTSKAVLTAAGAGIGALFGAGVGAIIGAGIGAAVGFVIEGIADVIRSLESDSFPPKDITLALQYGDASFAGDDPSRHINYLRFEGLGGRYLLTYEWRLQSATTCSNVHGQPFTVARKPEHLDLFVVGNDGKVYTSWWVAGSDWSGINNNWRAIGGTFPVGAPVSAVARKPEHLDLFVVGNDGKVYTSWWVAGSDWSGINNNWRPIGGTFPPPRPR